MLNRKILNRKMKMKLDPSRINNYNKFLITLDKNPIVYKLDANEMDANEIDANKIDANKIDVNEMDANEKEDLKKNLDKIIDNITNNYDINNLNSSSFTGQTVNDISSVDMDIYDPNDYKEKINEQIMNININKIFKSCCVGKTKIEYIEINKIKKIDKIEKVKELVNIEEEINNINDIILLTEKYKLEPEIKYNINMQALHNIKEPLQELNDMIGMTELKNNIVDQILYFIQDLHKNNNSSGDFMHTVIYGPPGTGKTEIAKIMGKIYSKLGVLDKGTFKKATRSDLIAGYLGQTALKTREVIKEAIGGVLFIDEAYALGNSEKRDSFAKECIDTLCEALSDNKDNLMVIIAGYETELKECFFNYNQGLDSRFVWRFKTDKYTAEDLYNIFVKKVKDIGWQLHEESKITSDFFKKNYDYLKFFGRDIETILAKTKISHSKRVFCKPDNEKKKITIKDLEKGFELYLQNDDIKNRKDSENMKKQLYNSIYS